METAIAEAAPSPVSGFWRRLAAFVIDGLALGVLGMIAGFMMFDTLAQLGPYGRALGFAVALLYFGVLNSWIGGGQTLGKRALSIRAVTLDGQLMSLPRSLLRYSVLGIPFFLNNAPLPLDVVMSPWGYALSLIVFGGMLSILYLLVFNRTTRRSLHDFAVGSWVVRTAAPASPAHVPRLWRGHVIAVTLLMAIALSLPLLTQRLTQLPVFAELLPALEAINAEPGVKYATLNAGSSFGNSGDHTYVAATLQLDHPRVEDKSFAKRIASKILQTAPGFAKRDVIAVTLRYGYDLGIATGWRSYAFQFAPGELVSAKAP